MNTISVHLKDSDRERSQFLKLIFHPISCPFSFLRFLGSMAIVSILAGCAQRRVDAQMEELCRKDGGMKIFEQISLSPDQYRNGIPAFFGDWDEQGRKGGGFTVTADSKWLKSTLPTLVRRSYSVVRDSDHRVLGTFTYYQRVGGDIVPRLGPDSSASCPADDQNEITFINSVFVKQTDSRGRQ